MTICAVILFLALCKLHTCLLTASTSGQSGILQQQSPH